MRAKKIVEEYFQAGFQLENIMFVLTLLVETAKKEVDKKRPKTEEGLSVIYSKYYQKWLDICYTEGGSLAHSGYWRILKNFIPRDHVDILRRNRPKWAKDTEPLA